MAEDIYAFPSNEKNHDGSHFHSHGGMGLRDWFAGQALAGFTVATNSNIEPERYAWAAYSLADAMLAERERRS
jgi:hypothetical protein